MNTTLAQVLATKGTAVVRVRPDDSVFAAVVLMNRERVGSVVVGDLPEIGVFTERDVLTRVVEPGLDPVRTAVRDVATWDPVCATPDWTVLRSMRHMTATRQRHLLVHAEGALQGIVSLGDLVYTVSQEIGYRFVDLSRYVHGPFCVPDVPELPQRWR